MTWLLWAALLIAQNFAFTFVSRARNSASLKRHIVAAMFSNGIWFASQLIIVSKMFDMITGKYGPLAAIGTGLFYTVFTISGSVLAHKISLATEKGKGAVGASAQYAQITKEEWEAVKAVANYHLQEKI
jgi:hypothetical protein